MAWDDVLKEIEADGLHSPEVGAWMEDKHRLLVLYASVFLRSMRDRWETLVYLDLFAGAGHCRPRGKQRHFRASPLAVLALDQAFDKYIFCESDPEKAAALTKRANRDAPKRRVAVVQGDANEEVDAVLSEVPVADRGSRVLSLCFLDPYKLKNLRFETIRRLSERYMDFLILIPSGMDANRARHPYTRAADPTLDNFLGSTAWRERWGAIESSKASFERFVVEEMALSMATLGYLDPGLENAAMVRSDEKNLLLYRLVLYSRHPLARKFWSQTQKYTNPQIGMDF